MADGLDAGMPEMSNERVSGDAGFPKGGFSCAEIVLQSLNLAATLPAQSEQVGSISQSQLGPALCNFQ